MEMPRPTEAHRKFEKLAGNWTGEEIMHPSPWDPKGGTAVGRTRNRIDLGGFVVIVDYEQEREGQITFSGHGVYTYDQKEQCIVLYWFDCMGMQPNMFKGNFEGDVLNLVSDESTEGGPRFSRLTYNLGTPGTMTYRMELSEDGEAWKVFLDAAYARQE